tara:strand:+ start:121 stop:576 length:456 start_codon:yes stop_codon:yes gene_type:complete
MKCFGGKKMTNIKDLLEAELDYKTGTIKVKDIGKVDVKIENRELGSVNLASPGRESNYRTVGNTWNNKDKKVDIESVLNGLYSKKIDIDQDGLILKVNQSDIKDLYIKKTLTGKIQIGFSFKNEHYEPGQRETTTDQKVRIISNKRLRYTK